MGRRKNEFVLDRRSGFFYYKAYNFRDDRVSGTIPKTISSADEAEAFCRSLIQSGELIPIKKRTYGDVVQGLKTSTHNNIVGKNAIFAAVLTESVFKDILEVYLADTESLKSEWHKMKGLLDSSDVAAGRIMYLYQTLIACFKVAQTSFMHEWIPPKITPITPAANIKERKKLAWQEFLSLAADSEVEKIWKNDRQAWSQFIFSQLARSDISVLANSSPIAQFELAIGVIISADGTYYPVTSMLIQFLSSGSKYYDFKYPKYAKALSDALVEIGISKEEREYRDNLENRCLMPGSIFKEKIPTLQGASDSDKLEMLLNKTIYNR